MPNNRATWSTFLITYSWQEAEKNSSCRIDWHQTASHVTVSVFAKVANPEKSWVEVNHVSLNFNIEYDGGKLVFAKCLILRGVSTSWFILS